METAGHRPRCHLLPAAAASASAASSLRLPDGRPTDATSGFGPCSRNTLAFSESWPASGLSDKLCCAVMSAGQQWQNGRISPKPPSAQTAECTRPLDAAQDRDAKKEPVVKANIVKTYEYKISMSYDELVGRPTMPTTCQDSGSVTRPAGTISSGSGSCTDGPLLLTTAAEPVSVPLVGVGPSEEAVVPLPQQQAATACKQLNASLPARSAAMASVGPRHLIAASVPQGCCARDDGVADSVAELCPAFSEPPAGHCPHRPAEHGRAADGCGPAAAAAVTTSASKLGYGYGVAPVKDYVHFFESRHDDPGSPRKFVPPAAASQAVAAAATAAAASSATSNGGLLAKSNGGLHHATDSSTIVTSPRTAGLRSNPAPCDTQQSLIRLSCAASGYGKYTPSSAVMRQAALALAEAQPVSAAAAQASAEAQPVPAVAEQSWGCTFGSHGVSASAADASDESKLNGHGIVSAVINGHGCPDLVEAATVLPSDVAVSSSHIAISINSQVIDEPRAGKQFLVRALHEEDRLNRLSQQSRDDVDSGLLAEEVCGLLRSAIGKATLLVTKKFKQFKELCNKNVNQGDDERYKTTSEDLQGFWDMMMLQVEDVDRAFTEIARLRANGWQYETSSCPKDVDANAGNVVDAAHIKTASDLPSTPSSGSARSKATPSRRNLGATPDNRNRKTSTSGGSAASATPASKAREEARQRLLAAKKAMRRNSMTSDDAGTTSADIVVFIGGNSTS